MSHARPLLVALLLSVLSPVAAAQSADAGAGSDAGTLGDGGIDLGDGGSAGEGGSDRDNPEADDHTGRVVTVCDFSTDCTRGFTCIGGHCTWTRYRDAEGGLCGVVSGLLFVGGIFVLSRKRAPRPPRR